MTAVTEEGHTIIGTGSAWFSDDGRSRCRFTIKRGPVELIGSLQWMHYLLTHLFKRITIKTSTGVLEATDAYVSGVSTAGVITIDLDSAVFRSSVAEEPYYWTVPLVNCLIHGTEISPVVDANPLRIYRGSYATCFDFHGKPAFIQGLPDFSKRIAELKSERRHNAATCILVGEIFPSFVAEQKWTETIRDGILPALSLAVGNRVTAPWIDLRSNSGELVERYFFRWGGYDFQEGHQALCDHPEPMIRKLLECVQTSRLYGDHSWAHIISHALQGGLKSRTTIELRCYHNCVALDDLCQRYGCRKQFLLKSLPSDTSAKVMEVIDKVINNLKELANRVRDDGDTTSAVTIRTIQDKVLNATNTDSKFASSLTELLNHPDFAFADVKVMEQYSGFLTVGTWGNGVNRCRNVVMHTGLLSASGIGVAHDAIPIIRHLRDILLRCILRLMKYDGTYSPPNRPDLLPVDWVKESLPPSELGYR